MASALDLSVQSATIQNAMDNAAEQARQLIVEQVNDSVSPAVAATVASAMQDFKGNFNSISQVVDKIVSNVPLQSLPAIVQAAQQAQKGLNPTQAIAARRVSGSSSHKSDRDSMSDDSDRSDVDEQVGYVQSRKKQKGNNGTKIKPTRGTLITLANRMTHLQPIVKEQRERMSISKKELLAYMTQKRIKRITDEGEEKEYIRERAKPKIPALKAEHVDRALKSLRLNKDVRRAVIEKVQKIREDEADTSKKYNLKVRQIKRKKRARQQSDSSSDDEDRGSNTNDMDVD